MIWKLWSLKQQCKTCVKQSPTTLKYQNIPLKSTNSTEGSQARKKSFVEPLKELVKKCTSKGSSDVY